MRTRFVEVTNGLANWGKFMIGQYDENEWRYMSTIYEGMPLLRSIGYWSRHHIWVFDLQTGEAASFLPGGSAAVDLNKHRIWVCPLFERFLTWLYEQPDPFQVPATVDFPGEPGTGSYRRPGPTTQQ